MLAAFDLLDNQPSLWPKWQLARDSHGRLQYVKHMFLFEPFEFEGLGRPIPACRFVDGAEWVERAPKFDQALASDGDPLCLDCMEVSLQHGLARM